MLEMMKKNINLEKFYSKLLFNTKDIINLDKLGHLVGLHSHSHPTLIENLVIKSKKMNIQLI